MSKEIIKKILEAKVEVKISTLIGSNNIIIVFKNGKVIDYFKDEEEKIIIYSSFQEFLKNNYLDEIYYSCHYKNITNESLGKEIKKIVSDIDKILISEV